MEGELSHHCANPAPLLFFNLIHVPEITVKTLEPSRTFDIFCVFFGEVQDQCFDSVKMLNNLVNEERSFYSHKKRRKSVRTQGFSVFTVKVTNQETKLLKKIPN